MVNLYMQEKLTLNLRGCSYFYLCCRCRVPETTWLFSSLTQQPTQSSKQPQLRRHLRLTPDLFPEDNTSSVVRTHDPESEDRNVAERHVWRIEKDIQHLPASSFTRTKTEPGVNICKITWWKETLSRATPHLYCVHSHK